MTKPTDEPEQLNMLDSGPSKPLEAAEPAAKPLEAQAEAAAPQVAPPVAEPPAAPEAQPPSPPESSPAAVSVEPAPLGAGELAQDDDDYVETSLENRFLDGELLEPSRDEQLGGAKLEAARPVLPAAQLLPTLRPWQDSCAGAVLGAAIGDAMGHPTEFLGSVESIKTKYGPQGVTKFELFWDRDGRHFAPYTDDTQMAEAVLRSLLESKRSALDLDAAMIDLAARFVEWSRRPQGGHRAPGSACLSGCRALEAGTHWSKAGGPTAGGCGSVMRAYPFGLLFAHDLKKAEHWAVEHSKLTHRDPIALAACAAMAVGVARLARGEHPRSVTAQMVAAACRYSASTAAMMATAIDEARTGVGPEVTLDRLRAWAAHEAIAAAVYLVERHPDDPKAAILEGANTPGDSDSIATLGGALLGARCGARALPADWVAQVERADELLALALEL